MEKPPPTHPAAFKKLLPMAGLIFCILCIYSLIYCLRDSLVIPTLGAGVYSFLEFWVMLPSALLVTLLYLKLSSVIRHKELIFYIFSCAFLAFFFYFAFYLYPHRDALMPEPAVTLRWTQQFPHLKWFIIIISAWPYTLFNIACELWASVMLSVLFWQLANRITSIDEAKRYYPFFGFVGNISLIAAGSMVHYYAAHHQEAMLVKQVVYTVLALSVISMLLYRYVHDQITKNPSWLSPKESNHSKASPSLRKSIRLILRSRYLWYMALLVICYGFSINISQSMWKAQAAQYYTSGQGYAAFMGEYQRWLGIASIFFMVLTSWMLPRCRWFTSAITPIVITGISGLAFFSWLSFSHCLASFVSLDRFLYLSIMIGMVEVTLSKAMKFSLFDSTKEIAYIPLPPELKSEGKGAVDMLGERFGKSSGALIQTIIFSAFPALTYIALAPWFFILFLCIMLLWLYAAVLLNKEYSRLVKSV